MRDTNAALVSEDRRKLLEDDLTMIRESLDGFGSYRFSSDLIERMSAKGISANELARRCRVSHAAIGKWRSGGAKPVGKERIKEVGLALSMESSEINAMLLSLGYAGLYARNPLDNACLLAIRKEPVDPVGYYRDIVEEFRLKEVTPSPFRKSFATPEVQKSFDHVYTESSFKNWLSKYADGFNAFAKTVIPNKELILYAMLFLGGTSINEMYVTGELPISIRNMLYPLIAGSEIGQKGLMEKLVIFGLLRNMPEEEIDRLLELAKLRPFSRPKIRCEAAALAAVRCAHSRYPMYEYECLGSICAILGALLENEEADLKQETQTDSMEFRRTFYSDLRTELLPRIELSERLADNYLKPGMRGDDELLFERLYTDADAKSLAHYVKDILEILIEDGDIEFEEAEEMLELMQL